MLKDSCQKWILKLFRRLLVISILMTSIIGWAEQNPSESDATAAVRSANSKLDRLKKNPLNLFSNSNSNSIAHLKTPNNWDQFLPTDSKKPPYFQNKVDSTNPNQVAH